MNTWSLLLLFSTYLFSNIQGQSLQSSNPTDDWNLEEVLSLITNDTARTEKINSVLSELIAKADKLYHRVEGEVKDLTKGSIHAAHLNPAMVNRDCSCYCHCPQNTINNNVLDDVKLKVFGLKYKFMKLGGAIKKKIHDLTSR